MRAMADVDFGTYHHTTPKQSLELREYAGKMFSSLLRPLFSADAKLRILDAGCGLGFLTYLAAESFPQASVVGVDLFKHDSVSGLSMDKAMENMKSIGVDSRTSFLRHDLTRPLESGARYDLVLSNLVFHNMGKKRFAAYGTVFDALKPEGYFVVGDLFRHKADTEYFEERAALVDELEGSGLGDRGYKMKVMRKK